MLHDPPSELPESSTVAQLQQQLKSSNEVQAKFLSFLSHDLRGELNGVLLTVELLKHQLAGEPKLAQSVEDLNAIRGAIFDALGVMDRFIQAERMRHGRVKPKNADVDVRQLLADVAAQFANDAKAKGIELRLQESAPLRLSTDKDLLKLILQNLVSNAVNFSSGGSVLLTSNARISVVDQGPGIPADRLPTIFEPFAGGQLRGKGIGLYLSRQAAELVGAKLSVESSPGKGSAFHLEFSK
jgi:signal transduction histidine kinase